MAIRKKIKTKDRKRKRLQLNKSGRSLRVELKYSASTQKVVGEK